MRKIGLFLFVIGLSFGLSAQVQWGVFFTHTKALNEFSQNLDRNPGGIAVNVLAPIKNSPLRVGGELGVSHVL